MTDTRDPAHWHALAAKVRAGEIVMVTNPCPQQWLDQLNGFRQAIDRAVGIHPDMLGDPTKHSAAAFGLTFGSAFQRAVQQIGQATNRMAQQFVERRMMQSTYLRQMNRASRRAKERAARRTMSKRAFRRWRARQRANPRHLTITYRNVDPATIEAGRFDANGKYVMVHDGRLRGTRAHSIVVDDPEGDA